MFAAELWSVLIASDTEVNSDACKNAFLAEGSWAMG